MITADQIQAAYAKVKSGADYPSLVQDLKRIGVRSYYHLVADGSNVFTGTAGETVTTDHLGPPQAVIAVSERSSIEKLLHYIAIHQQGQTNYPTLCVQAGEAGVDRWVSDLEAMTCTYHDKAGKVMHVEAIPEGKY